MSPNSTRFTFFTLSAYFGIGHLRYFVFILLLTVYILMLLSNALLIAVISLNQSLRAPMYVFICSLFFNCIIGSTTLFPFILLQILRDVHVISGIFCFVQIYATHFYGMVEYYTLSAMSYDRYLAICSPLQYHARMTRTKIIGLIAFPWFYSCVMCAIMVFLSSSLQLCGNVIDKVYCDNYSIIKLSCNDTTGLNLYGLCISVFNIFSPLTLILYTYVHILKVCFSGSKHMRQKALSNCTPHIASLLCFGLGALFEIIQNRFDMSNAPNIVRVFLSLYFFMFQPLLDPFMHGLNISKIRLLCKSLLLSKL